MRKIQLDLIDMTRPRVRYNGEVQDKCQLAGLIHDVALMAGNSIWPLYSDIYWDSATYVYLKAELNKWMERVER